MKFGKITLFILAAFSLIFSFILFLGSFSQTGTSIPVWFSIILATVGFILIFFGTRMQAPSSSAQNVTVNIDFPGEVGMDTIKCKSCGGVLSEKDIKLVAGAPMVTCPFCGTSYQLSEEPKW
jgi:uncharacterized membrane protein